MATAVQNLREPDPELQVLGAAYIQHECYNDSDAKVEVQIKLAVRIPPKTFVLSCSIYVNRALVDVSLALMLQPFVGHHSFLNIDPDVIILKGRVQSLLTNLTNLKDWDCSHEKYTNSETFPSLGASLEGHWGVGETVQQRKPGSAAFCHRRHSKPHLREHGQQGRPDRGGRHPTAR